MAQVTVETETVTKHQFKGIVMTLSVKEALAIVLLSYHVGGDPYRSLRSEFDALSYQLEKIGVNREGFEHLIDNTYDETLCFEYINDLHEDKIKALENAIAEKAAFNLNTLTNVDLEYNLRAKNRIGAIKILRELASEAGHPLTLLDAKHEIDRRASLTR